ncbi:MAG: MoaD/ThiS family protein [Thermovirgaceae bacterium]
MRCEACMGISVQVYIEGIPGLNEFSVFFDASGTVADVLEKMKHIDNGEPYKQVVEPSTGKPRYLIVAINGQMVRFPEAFERPLNDGDELLFISPVVGG